MAPLTARERDFAAAHLDIVFRFLHLYRLPADDWFDVVIFRYLRTVHRWHTELELHYYAFSTVAVQAMSSAVWAERKKQSRRIQAMSLDAPVPGFKDLTYADIITADNLIYA